MESVGSEGSTWVRKWAVKMEILGHLLCIVSAGHRVCLGEQMARIELFIFFSNLLRAFKFTLPEGVTEINTKIIFGSTMQPHPYKLCAIPR